LDEELLHGVVGWKLVAGESVVSKRSEERIRVMRFFSCEAKIPES
jgi:hypothetical protein